MYCPVCNAKMEVEDTIQSNKNVYRHIKCKNCGGDYYTEETIVQTEKVKPMFTEWSRERSRKSRAKKKGFEYDPKFSDGREERSAPKKPTSPLF